MKTYEIKKVNYKQYLCRGGYTRGQGDGPPHVFATDLQRSSTQRISVYGTHLLSYPWLPRAFTPLNEKTPV